MWKQTIGPENIHPVPWRIYWFDPPRRSIPPQFPIVLFILYFKNFGLFKDCPPHLKVLITFHWWGGSGYFLQQHIIFVFLGKPTIIQAPSLLSTYVGLSGIFHCVVVGNPKPTVRWKNSSNAIITSGGRFEVFSNESLKISNLLKSDDGSFFTCEAENSYGTTTASTTLRVTGQF